MNKTKIGMVSLAGATLIGLLASGSAMAAGRYVKSLFESGSIAVNGRVATRVGLLNFDRTLYAPVASLASALGGKARIAHTSVNLTGLPGIVKGGAVLINGAPVPNASVAEVNGQAYVSANAVASYLNVPNEYNQKTGQLAFGPQPAGSWFRTLFPTPYSLTPGLTWSQPTTKFTMAGTSYSRSYGFSLSGPWPTPGSGLTTALNTYVYFNLGGRWNRLTGLVGVDDSSATLNSGKTLKVEIIGNGNILDTINLTQGALPSPINLSIAGVKSLKFDVLYSSAYQNNALSGQTSYLSNYISAPGNVQIDFANLKIY